MSEKEKRNETKDEKEKIRTQIQKLTRDVLLRVEEVVVEGGLLPFFIWIL